MKTSELARLIFLMAALALAIAGQFYFARKPDYFWDGVLLYGLAVLLLLLALRRPRPPATTRAQPVRWQPALTWRAVLVGLAALLAVVAVLQLMSERASYWPTFGIWLAAGGLYLLGFVHRPEWSWRSTSTGGLAAAAGAAPAAAAEGLRRWPARVEWLIVALLMAAALALRVWHIDTIPWTLSGDEANFGLWARSALNGQVRNMFVTGHLSMPTMYTFFQAAWLRMAGDNILGLRLPWAVLGTLTVLGTYLLVRRLFNAWLALLTGLLLATYHYHIHYSRLGVNNISDPLFISWAMYFLVLGWQARRRWAWAASGALCGLAFYSYTGSRFVPILAAAVLGWGVLVDRACLRRHARDLLAMAGAFLIVFGPMGLFALQHPDDFNARINQIGIIQSGWLDQAARLTGQSKLSLLLEQAKRAFFAFNFLQDRTAWYQPGMPLLDFAASVFFVLGLATAALHSFTSGADGDAGSGSGFGPAPAADALTRRLRYMIFVAWFALAVLIGGALTESPPSSQRLVATAVPVCFFMALAVNEIVRVMGEVLAWHDGWRAVSTLALVLFLAFVSLRFYFVTYQQSWAYGSINGEVATRIGYYLRDLSAGPTAGLADAPAASGPPAVAYFLGAPRMYADFGSISFIDRGLQMVDIVKPLTEPPQVADPGVPLVFVFLPERVRELEWVRQAYPGGVVDEVHRLDDPAAPLLFVAYRVG